MNFGLKNYSSQELTNLFCVTAAPLELGAQKSASSEPVVAEAELTSFPAFEGFSVKICNRKRH